jgi:dTDP-glucose 4,6-dehydratase
MKGCDYVLHLAALIAIPYSYHSPDTYIDTNVKGTLNVVQAARDLGVQKVIHTSTSEVYGTARFVPISEEHPLTPQSPYSASKIAADQVALSFWHSFSTPVLVLRPFNTYGPRQSARAVIPTVITQLAAGQKKLMMGALEPTRDFSFVQDTADGFLAALESDAGIGEVVNLGSGFEISIGDTVKTISELMNVSVPVDEDSQRVRPQSSEVYRLFSDNSKARRLFGWRPSYGGIEGFKRGLAQTIEWFIKAENLNEYKTGIYNI